MCCDWKKKLNWKTCKHQQEIEMDKEEHSMQSTQSALNVPCIRWYIIWPQIWWNEAFMNELKLHTYTQTKTFNLLLSKSIYTIRSVYVQYLFTFDCLFSKTQTAWILLKTKIRSPTNTHTHISQHIHFVVNHFEKFDVVIYSLTNAFTRECLQIPHFNIWFWFIQAFWLCSSLVLVFPEFRFCFFFLAIAKANAFFSKPSTEMHQNTKKFMK